MTISFSQLLRNKFPIIIKKIALDLMLWNVPTANSLPFENELRFFGFQDRKSFFIEILLNIVLGFGIDKDSCALSLTCLLTPFKVVPNFAFVSGDFGRRNYTHKVEIKCSPFCSPNACQFRW